MSRETPSLLRGAGSGPVPLRPLSQLALWLETLCHILREASGDAVKDSGLRRQALS